MVPVLWTWSYLITLRWRHNGHDSVTNRQPYDCLLNRLFRYWSKKTSKLRLTGLCVGNSPVTGEFPAQMASNAENVSISWRHHDAQPLCYSWRYLWMRYNGYIYLTCYAFTYIWLMITSSRRNIFRVTGPLSGEFTGLRWSPRTKASDAELWWFLWSEPE